MFDNTVNLLNGVDAAEAVAITKIEPDRILRGSSDRTKVLSIAQGQSNENPGFETARTVVRLSKSKEIEDTGKSVTAYAQLTVSAPMESFTAADIQKLAAQLMNFTHGLAGGDEIHWDVSTNLIPRLAAGEK